MLMGTQKVPKDSPIVDDIGMTAGIGKILGNLAKCCSLVKKSKPRPFMSYQLQWNALVKMILVGTPDSMKVLLQVPHEIHSLKWRETEEFRILDTVPNSIDRGPMPMGIVYQPTENCFSTQFQPQYFAGNLDD